MPKMVVRRPFDKFELPDHDRLQPPAMCHLCRRKSSTPASAPRFRQVGKRAFSRFEPSEFRKQFLAELRCKSVARAGGIQQLFAFVVAEDEGIESLSAQCITANHELLPLIDPHLPPRTRAHS